MIKIFQRWLLLMSLQKAFNKFKQFMRQPTILGSLLLLVLSTPSSAAFHLLYNKFGFGFRPSILVNFRWIYSIFTHSVCLGHSFPHCLVFVVGLSLLIGRINQDIPGEFHFQQSLCFYELNQYDCSDASTQFPNGLYDTKKLRRQPICGHPSDKVRRSCCSGIFLRIFDR